MERVEKEPTAKMSEGADPGITPALFIHYVFLPSWQNQIYTSVLADSEAGPDIAEFDVEEFQPATAEAFKDPNAFDFLSQHGQSNDAAANLAR